MSISSLFTTDSPSIHVNLLMVIRQMQMEQIKTSNMETNHSHDNKIKIGRDVKTLVDYRNKSTAATRKIRLEDKTKTEREVGWLWKQIS